MASSDTITMATGVTSPRPFLPQPLTLARRSQWAQPCPITAEAPPPFLTYSPFRPALFLSSATHCSAPRRSPRRLAPASSGGADPGCYISGRRGGALPDCSRVFSALVVPLLPWQPRSARSAPSARPLSGPAPAACTSAHPGRTGPDPAVGTTGTLGMNGADPPAAAPRAAG